MKARGAANGEGPKAPRRKAPAKDPAAPRSTRKSAAAADLKAPIGEDDPLTAPEKLADKDDKTKERVTAARRQRSQLLANMSRELRTPLNAIMGYSEALRTGVVGLGQEGLAGDLKKIESAGRHLLGLVKDILDLSKIEDGTADIAVEDVELIPLLEEVRALVVPLAAENNNTLDLRLLDDLRHMRTDRAKLKQCLLKVLNSASTFTENARVILTAERWSQGSRREMVRFVISDNSSGLTEEELSRLFEPFGQADPAATSKYGGTGLGLVIARHFCRLLGGDIAVTSTLGKGSTFTLTLPARSRGRTRTKEAEPETPPALSAREATVLIVDDDPAARELLTANLRGAGYRLVHAAPGPQALNVARTARPDAITLDVMRPRPDGWEVLKALKADADLCEIPVIMVTVAPERGIGVSLGAVDVLTKPVDRTRLTALVYRLVLRAGPVLVVGEDALAREMMRRTIEKMRLPVASVANVQKALAWLGEHPTPAAILIDLMVPETGGFELLDALAARAEWREVPVVLVTAKQFTAAERERLLLQAHKAMEKNTAGRIDIAVAVGEALRRPARPAAGGAAV